MPAELVLILLCVVGGIAIFGFAVLFEAMFYWSQARLSGVRIPFRSLFRNRSTPGKQSHTLKKLVIAAVRAHKSRLAVTFDQLADHHRAGGNVQSVVSALIAARAHGLDAGAAFSMDDACQMDLSGQDPFEFVQQHTGSKPEHHQP